MRCVLLGLLAIVGCTTDAPPFEKIDAIPMPVVACTAARELPDADPFDLPCHFPPATCADDRYLVYFTGGQCVQNRCTFEKKFYRCIKRCASVECISPHEGPTAAAADQPPDFWQ